MVQLALRPGLQETRRAAWDEEGYRYRRELHRGTLLQAPCPGFAGRQAVVVAAAAAAAVVAVAGAASYRGWETSDPLACAEHRHRRSPEQGPPYPYPGRPDQEGDTQHRVTSRSAEAFAVEAVELDRESLVRLHRDPVACLRS